MGHYITAHCSLTLKISNGKSHTQLSSSSIAELKWWIANMPTVQRDIVRPNPCMVIQTDASKKGWGAALGNQEIGGRWTDAETSNHINFLELQAAFFLLGLFVTPIVTFMYNYRLTTQRLWLT